MNFSTPELHCKALLWLIQRKFTAAEFGRFVRTLNPTTTSPLTTLSAHSIETLQSLALECLVAERRARMEPEFHSLSGLEPNTLLSRSELEVVLHKPLPTDFPLVLRYAGTPDVLKRKRVAIIGARHPTFYGREQAARFARSLSEAGLCVVSGAAIGIDTVANLIAHSCGASVAVLGSGLAAPYPRSNIPLLHSMAHSGRGLVLSEFDDTQRAEKWNFPRRNRIIAALCDFLLVVEARLGSGSLITAHLAADCGVEVGALPGPVHAPTSQGANLLIKEGAFCIESPEEILERLCNLGHQRGR